MSVAKITEISAESTRSFEDAMQVGIKRAAETIEQIKGGWVKEQSVVVEDGRITGYRVLLKLTFVLKE
jgi:flavin-binding protein dodecin